MVGRRADRCVFPDCPGGGVEPVEDAVLSDGPHQPRRHDGRAAADRGAPEEVDHGGGGRRLHGDGAAQAGEVDRRAHHGHATVDVTATGVPELRLLVPDPTEGGPVEQVDDA